MEGEREAGISFTSADEREREHHTILSSQTEKTTFTLVGRGESKDILKGPYAQQKGCMVCMRMSVHMEL